jgi:hypothetical protein
MGEDWCRSVERWPRKQAIVVLSYRSVEKASSLELIFPLLKNGISWNRLRNPLETGKYRGSATVLVVHEELRMVEYIVLESKVNFYNAYSMEAQSGANWQQY